ncbi:ATP-binding protein [Marinospirillum sp.]|uniref:ATP-binding protein n=1 Tax=Marinospirillum sp. TaxID=2183934 RepID=UPI00384C19D1
MKAAFKSGYPQSLAGQLIVLLVLILLIGQLISFWLLADERRERLHEVRIHHALQRLLSTRDLLVHLPKEAHQQLLDTLSSPALELTLATEPLVTAEKAHDPDRLHPRLNRNLPLQDLPLNLRLLEPEADCSRPSHESSREEKRRHWRRCQPRMEASLQLDSAPGWLNLQQVNDRSSPPWPVRVWISLLVSGLLAALLVGLVVRRLTGPLQDLAGAAASFGLGKNQPVQEKGPSDLREVIQAFNRMQEKVGRQLEERAHLLAALSHDLRTPLTQMRLRLELLPESQDKQRLLASLANMQNLAETSLDFVRGSSGESRKKFDLGSLVASLVEDYQEKGESLILHSSDRLVCQGRPQAVRRALQNLIDNALKYAGEAEITLLKSDRQLVIRVEDSGPGIPDEERERVLDPFYRMEASRSAETGGTGLGLSIAYNLIQQEGGQLQLKSRSNGESGLLAEIRLPLIEA